MITSPVAVLVDADLVELRKSEQVLERAGFVVMSADSFAEAKSLLASMTPEIVIADIKLQAYNGLHLAALCAVWRPGTPFIATHSVYDGVLDADAKRLCAAYVVKTSSREQLTITALKMLESRRHGGDIRRTCPKRYPDSHRRPGRGCECGGCRHQLRRFAVEAPVGFRRTGDRRSAVRLRHRVSESRHFAARRTCVGHARRGDRRLVVRR